MTPGSPELAMRTDNGRTVSVWMASSEILDGSSLQGDVATDVCIVGAGIAGLTTAYLLAKEGRRVVVIDDGATAGGETCRTTAHLVNALDDRFYHLDRLRFHAAGRLLVRTARRRSVSAR